jgi:hypothetical protein
VITKDDQYIRAVLLNSRSKIVLTRLGYLIRKQVWIVLFVLVVFFVLTACCPYIRIRWFNCLFCYRLVIRTYYPSIVCAIPSLITLISSRSVNVRTTISSYIRPTWQGVLSFLVVFFFVPTKSSQYIRAIMVYSRSKIVFT